MPPWGYQSSYPTAATAPVETTREGWGERAYDWLGNHWGRFGDWLQGVADINDDRRLGLGDAAIHGRNFALGGPMGLGMGVAKETVSDRGGVGGFWDWLRNRGNEGLEAPAVRSGVGGERFQGRGGAGGASPGVKRIDPSVSEPRRYAGHTGGAAWSSGFGGSTMLDASASGRADTGFGGMGPSVVRGGNRSVLGQGGIRGTALRSEATGLSELYGLPTGLVESMGGGRGSSPIFGGYDQGSPMSGIERYLQEQQQPQGFHAPTPEMGMFQQPPAGFQRDPIWPEISRESSYMMPVAGGPPIPVIEGPRWLGPRWSPEPPVYGPQQGHGR